jgi:hypothetical protein
MIDLLIHLPWLQRVQVEGEGEGKGKEVAVPIIVAGEEGDGCFIVSSSYFENLFLRNFLE